MKMVAASSCETLGTNYLNHGVHILEYCNLHQQCCQNPQVTNSPPVLRIVFYSVLKESDNDTRVSRMKTLNIFFKYYLLCRSGTKLYHFST